MSDFVTMATRQGDGVVVGWNYGKRGNTQHPNQRSWPQSGPMEVRNQKGRVCGIGSRPDQYTGEGHVFCLLSIRMQVSVSNYVISYDFQGYMHRDRRALLNGARILFNDEPFRHHPTTPKLWQRTTQCKSPRAGLDSRPNLCTEHAGNTHELQNCILCLEMFK